MEAAGVVFGAIPLLISAVENYEVTFAPFVTFHRYIKEIQKFSTTLGIQRTIFRNQCQLLLLAVNCNLVEVLRDSKHLQSDPELEKQLKKLLGSSYNSCKSTLHLINDTLKKVTEETAGFRDVLAKERGNGKGHHLRQRIKISFAKTRLNEIVDELRLQNEDFTKLSIQISQLEKHSAKATLDSSTKSSPSDFQITQQASSGLFHDLNCVWSCDTGIEHVASMSLHVGDCCRNKTSKVSFNLAFKCAQHVREPLRVVIESAPNNFREKIQPENPSYALQNSLKEVAGSRNTVLFVLPIEDTEIQPATSQAEFGPQPDDRLCKYFHDGSSCVITLEKTETFKHFVYPSPSSNFDSQTISLKEVLHMSTGEFREDEFLENLELAKLLSLAVLRFHSTPWLLDSWSSGDIRFFPDEISSKRLQNPCVDVELSSNSTGPKSKLPGSHTSKMATNEALFNLGVVLMELANGSTFETMSKDLQGSGLAEDSEFSIARRLGSNLHKKPALNITFQNLVEKCLYCNFGVPFYKLEHTELQRAVFLQVVSKLDEFLEQYKRFNEMAPYVPA